MSVPTRLRVPPPHDDVVAEVGRVVLQTRFLVLVVILFLVVVGRIYHQLIQRIVNINHLQSVFSALSQGLDDDFSESSIGRWADTAATYCPCRPMELSKMSSSKPCDRAEKTLCTQFSTPILPPAKPKGLIVCLGESPFITSALEGRGGNRKADKSSDKLREWDSDNGGGLEAGGG